MHPIIQLYTGDIFRTSELLNTVRTLRQTEGPSRLFGKAVRPLTPDEIRRLVSQGNACGDWSRILVVPDFYTESVSGNRFYGDCVLGLFQGEAEIGPGLALPSGLNDSVLVNAEIGNGALVQRAGLLSRALVGDGVVVWNVAAVLGGPGSTFGNGQTISVGNETGGRDVAAFAEITIPLAEAAALRRDDKGFLEAYSVFVKDYAEACKFDRIILSPGAVIRHAGKIERSFIGSFVTIDGAALVADSTILGADGESTVITESTIVRSSLIQWGGSIESGALVEGSVILEHARVERHGKVKSSFIGPNSVVGEGEVTASLTGPFTAAHHQSLLIGAVWPEGRGNIGYGANAGSNHTGKAPDQELRCGEGLFFGLGVNIKFPADFSVSPYTLIATGITTLPQKVEFPFSLINSVSAVFPDVPPAYHEIFPGWTLAENYYMILRNEDKFRKRNQARRTEFDADVFRPEIVEHMIRAKGSLVGVQNRKFYIERDLPGLGKNVMTEASRLAGIEAYSFSIEYYALMGLWLESSGQSDPYAEHRRQLRKAEGWEKRGTAANIGRLADMAEEISRRVEASKAKDDQRGKRISPDYDFVHVLAKDDPVVRAACKKAETIRQACAGK
jgi:carbonic anhydrase/acetyltransferase-like protein (isoleucine patch superfamily)